MAEIDKRFLIYDTETSGQQGVPMWHSENRIIQIAALHPQSQEMFKVKVNYGPDFYLAPKNVQIHKIGVLDLQASGKLPEEAIDGFMDFQARLCGPEPIWVAHNATFDFNMIRKMLTVVKGQGFDRGASGLGVKQFCSLLFFRTEFPDLEYIFEPEDRPYSLGSLYHYFFKERVADSHDATVDVKMLERLFREIILPMGRDLSKYYINQKPEESARMTLLKNVAYLGEFRVHHIANEIRKAFMVQGNEFGFVDYKKFLPSQNLCSVAHLLLYGQMRYLQHTLGKKKLDPLERCEWFEILRHCEILLRERPVGISSDSIIANVLAHVAGVDVVDLLFHTMKENGDTDFFPTTKGTPLAYKPMPVSADEAKFLHKEGGWGTISEMVADYVVNAKSGVSMAAEINRYLRPSIPHHNDSVDVEGHLNSVLRYS